MMRTLTRAWRTSGAALVLVLLLAGAGSAQDTGTLDDVTHQQSLTANPFLLLLEWFNVEYDRKISEATSVGVSGSLVDFDGGDEQFLSLNGHLRFYPQGAGLVGFYVGPRVGVYRVEDFGGDVDTAMGLGFDVGYNWLLGQNRSFVVGIGVGLSRLFGIDTGDADITETIPTVRLVNLGWAF